VPTDDQIRGTLESSKTIDRLAAVEHERWSHWQQYVHDQGERQSDGSLLIPAEIVAHWDKQIVARFADLSDEERQSDREQVLRYLPVVLDILISSQS